MNVRLSVISWSILLLFASCVVRVRCRRAPPYYAISYEASDKPGELAMPVTYTIWIPEA